MSGMEFTAENWDDVFKLTDETKPKADIKDYLLATAERFGPDVISLQRELSDRPDWVLSEDEARHIALRFLSIYIFAKKAKVDAEMRRTRQISWLALGVSIAVFVSKFFEI